MTKPLAFFLLGMMCFTGMAFLNDVEDTLAHHYKTSIFWDEQGFDSYWYPDWTRAYVDGDPAKGRKKILGIAIPNIFFDGWHLCKLARNFLTISLCLFLLFALHLNYNPYYRRFIIGEYLRYLLYGSLYLYLSHMLFYDFILN